VVKKKIYLAWLIVFLPAMVFAQEKVEAPIWNVGDKWTFTGNGSIEVAKVDESGYILKFSDGACIIETQSCNAILFEKSTRNRINAVEGDKRKKYTMGFRRILEFPFSTGKQWKGAYSGPVLIGRGAQEQMALDYSEIFKIVGWEDVQVQAGKFKVLKLEYKAIASSPLGWGPKDLQFNHYYWYSPDAKYFVKCEYDKDWMKQDKQVFNWELTSFQLKK
jgi:hypothetical protein